MDDVIIIVTNILREINYQKSHHLSDPHRLCYTNDQIAIAHSTSIIVVRKIYFTVVICVYLIVLYLFCIKRSLSNLSSFHFQPKDSNTHVYAHSWLSNNNDRNQQNDQLLEGTMINYCYIISMIIMSTFVKYSLWVSDKWCNF